MSGMPERRRRLDHETVLSTAETLLEQHGLDSLTMTMLARELGTQVSSLYNHVANLEDLRGEIQVRAMGQLAVVVRSAAMGRSGRDGLHAIADAFLAFARDRPHRYDAMTRAPLDRDQYFAAAAGAIEAVAVMVGTTGVTQSGNLAVEMALFAALHGYAALETGGFLGPIDGDLLDTDAIFGLVVEGAITAVLNQAPTPAVDPA